MGKRVKVEVECDRCGTVEEVTKDNKSRYGDFPEGWGDIEFKEAKDFRLFSQRESEYVLCGPCVVEFGKWYRK